MAEPSLSDNLAKSLAELTISGSNDIAILQEQHRLAILERWFGSLEAAYSTLSQKDVLEIGCGQGDMTVALAHFVRGDETARGSSIPEGKVLAIDPAPLDYGAPFTLGQAQSHLSSSSLGSYIKWIQEDPIKSLDMPSALMHLPRYIALAHSIFYLESRTYFEQLLKAIIDAYADCEGPPMLLIAEWGMRASCAAAEPHLLAVEAQLADPILDGNIRTVLFPEEIKSIANDCGWALDCEDWIVNPMVHDGSWEAQAARESGKGSNVSHEASTILRRMEDNIARNQTDSIQSMDVWTAVFVMKVRDNTSRNNGNR